MDNLNAAATPARITTPAKIAKLIKHHCQQNGKKPKCGVTFLVGAGFSVSAGIPTAGQIVKDVLSKHPLLDDVIGKTPPNQSEYIFLMSELPPEERSRIIREAIIKAQDPK